MSGSFIDYLLNKFSKGIQGYEIVRAWSGHGKLDSVAISTFWGYFDRLLKAVIVEDVSKVDVSIQTDDQKLLEILIRVIQDFDPTSNKKFFVNKEQLR